MKAPHNQNADGSRWDWLKDETRSWRRPQQIRRARSRATATAMKSFLASEVVALRRSSVYDDDWKPRMDEGYSALALHAVTYS
jgi:hypothetical protein